MMYKGRGAVSNPTGRYNPTQSQSDTDEAMPAPQTVFYRETAKSIISRNQSPDVPFEQSINPYRGCEHGCIYWTDAARRKIQRATLNGIYAIFLASL